MKRAPILAVATIFLLISTGYSPASDGEASLADAVEHYQSARFEKAKEILVLLSAEKHEDAVIQKALVYLALIEIAYRNFGGADAYIRNLISIYPAAGIEDIRAIAEDLPPAFTERFNNALISADPLPPSAEMSRIQGRYPQGEMARIKITAQDNRALKSLSFSVEKTDIKAEWVLEGKSASVEDSFSTREWAEGVYRYQVRVSDETGNFRDYEGTLAVVPPVDAVKPTAEVIGIAPEYQQGEKIRFKIKAMDDRGLKALYFILEGTDITREWAVEGKSETVEEALSTEGLADGIHRYRVRVWDERDNTRDYEGTFAIARPAEIRQISVPRPKPKGDGYLNIVSKPWTEIYINGKAYGRTPKAKLKLPAGNIIVRFVNRELGIDETRTFTILPDQLVKKSFDFK